MSKGEIADDADCGGGRSVAARDWRGCGAAECAEGSAGSHESQREKPGRCADPDGEGREALRPGRGDRRTQPVRRYGKEAPERLPRERQGHEAGRRLPAVPENLERQGRFRCQDRKLRQGRERGEREDQGSRDAESHRARHRQGMRRLPRDLSAEEQLARLRRSGCELRSRTRNPKEKGGRDATALFNSRARPVYFVTWPRISPPLLASVWTFT